MNYIRKAIEGKTYSTTEMEDPVERPSDMLYHAGISNPDDELEFLTVTDYEKFMKDNNLYKEGARRIIITGQMADATDLIKALEKEGYNVYPVQSMTRFMSFIDEVQPDAVINMAHGRMGDRMVDYLKTKNILLFAPLTINSLVDEWENDPLGMSGGFMSQSIVTPEIDGAIRPFALFAQYEDKEGLRHSYAIPERLKTFVYTNYGIVDGETEESRLIRKKLKDIDSDEQVRRAVRQANASYVLLLKPDFKDIGMYYPNYNPEAWEGIDGINDQTPGFTVVLERDSMKLYRIDD